MKYIIVLISLAANPAEDRATATTIYATRDDCVEQARYNNATEPPPGDGILLRRWVCMSKDSAEILIEMDR